MDYGFSEFDVKRVIQHELDKKPDLKYYINNPYFDEFIDLLIDGISIAIEKNNKRIIDDIDRELKMRMRAHGL